MIVETVKRSTYTAPHLPCPTRLVASAVLIGDKLWTDQRHWTCIQAAAKDTGMRVSQRVQGFITDTGRFVSREVAMVIARRNHQHFVITPPESCKKLRSEHIW